MAAVPRLVQVDLGAITGQTGRCLISQMAVESPAGPSWAPGHTSAYM
jgi:hypothetical protein